jgi:sirohydrochlorin cobaltochelatase
MAEPMHSQYIFVCQGKNCLAKGSRELLDEIRTRLADREAFRVVPFICFGACTASPNVAVFPNRLWYSTVTPNDIESVVEAILKREELPALSGHVSTGLKNLVFRMFGKPLRG